MAVMPGMLAAIYTTANYQILPAGGGKKFQSNDRFSGGSTEFILDSRNYRTAQMNW